MAKVVLRKTCQYCKFAECLKQKFGSHSATFAKTKLLCTNEKNEDDLKHGFIRNMTYINGYCDLFEWSQRKNYNSVLNFYQNMKREE